MPTKPLHIESESPDIPNKKSMTEIAIAKITDATTTTIVFACNSFQVGQETL